MQVSIIVHYVPDGIRFEAAVCHRAFFVANNDKNKEQIAKELVVELDDNLKKEYGLNEISDKANAALWATSKEFKDEMLKEILEIASKPAAEFNGCFLYMERILQEGDDCEQRK